MAAPRWARQGEIALSLAAALALLLFANYFAAKYWMQWDWTASRLYSLSQPTEGTLAELTTPVRIVSFLSDRQQPEVDSILREIRTLIDAYHSAAPDKIAVERIDFARDPLRAQDLLKEFKLDPRRDTLDVVVLAAGERTRLLRLDELVEFEGQNANPGAPPMIGAIRAEEAITGAIRALSRARQPRVLIAEGHGERGARDLAETGLGLWIEELERTDVAIDSWNGFAATSVPDGTDLLVIAGPQVTWLAPEVDAIARYLDQGGRVVLLLEPQLPRGTTAVAATGFEPLLARWGIVARRDLVIDRGGGVPFLGPETFAAPLLGLHPVCRGIESQRVLFSLSRSLQIESPPAEVEVNTLAESSPSAWGETDTAHLDAITQDPVDQSGPLGLLLAAERKPNGAAGRAARLLVAGDADLAANLFYGSASNRDLWLNAAAWLLDEQQALGIAPKDRTLTRLFVTDEQRTQLMVVLVFGLPALTVATGLLIWWTRRRGATR